MSDDERRVRLKAAVASETRREGTVAHMGKFVAVIDKGKPINYWLYALMVVVTVGAWAPVWIFLWIKNAPRQDIIRVDAAGMVSYTYVDDYVGEFIERLPHNYSRARVA